MCKLKRCLKLDFGSAWHVFIFLKTAVASPLRFCVLGWLSIPLSTGALPTPVYFAISPGWSSLWTSTPASYSDCAASICLGDLNSAPYSPAPLSCSTWRFHSLINHSFMDSTDLLFASLWVHTYTPSWTRVDLRWLKKICIMQQEKKEKEHWPMRELQGSANTIISSKPDSL